MTDTQHLAERANVRYATVGRGKRVHYSPRNDETLCGRFIGQYIDIEDAVELLNEKGFGWCARCTAAAQVRAEAARTVDSVEADAVRQVPAVHEFDSSREAYDATQCRDDIRDGDVLVIRPAGIVGFLVRAWPVAITEAHGELYTLKVPAREYENGAYVASVGAAEQIARDLSAPLADSMGDVVEGIVVGHSGVSEGSAPKHSTHPDVIAAREALRPLKPATLTEHIDTGRDADERDIDRSVRGYMIEPRGNGRVAAYWIEGGLHTLPDGEPHRVELGILRDKLKQAGWTIEPKSLTCVFAWHPTSGVQDVAEAELAETVEAVEQAEAAGGTWRGGWIASTPPPTGDVLFDLGPDDEQGALFA